MLRGSARVESTTLVTERLFISELSVSCVRRTEDTALTTIRRRALLLRLTVAIIHCVIAGVFAAACYRSLQNDGRLTHKNTRRAQTSAKANLARIPSPYPDPGYRSVFRIRTLYPYGFRNVTGTALFKCITFCSHPEKDVGDAKTRLLSHKS